MKTHFYTLSVLALLLITSCRKDETPNFEPPEPFRPDIINHIHLINCHHKNNSTHNEVWEKLLGTWKWNAEVKNWHTGIDSNFTSREGLKVKFLRNNELVIFGESHDTIFYDLRMTISGPEVKLHEEDMPHLAGKAYLCDRQLMIIPYERESMDITWYYRYE